jgi:hypothetical protein
MAQYMIARNNGPGRWEPLAWPSNPARFADAWNDLRRDGGHYQGFEKVEGSLGGVWQVSDTGPLEEVEAWTMIPIERHLKLERAERP